MSLFPASAFFFSWRFKNLEKNNGGQAIKNVNKIKMFLCTGRLQKCSAEQERAIIKAFKSMQTILTSADITFI